MFRDREIFFKMASEFTTSNQIKIPTFEAIKTSTIEEINNAPNLQATLEPSPIPSLEEFLGQTYRILYGDEFHPNYDRQLRKFVTHLVEVPELGEDVEGNDLPEDEQDQLMIDEASRVELVIGVKVLLEDEHDSGADWAELETASLIQQIHVILHEKEDKGDCEEVALEE